MKEQDRLVYYYKRIYPYVKPYLFRALIGLLLAIPIGALEAVVALSLKPYMDVVMIEKNMKFAYYIPFAIVGFTAIQAILNYVANYMNTWAGGKITLGLKAELFKKLLSLESRYFDKGSSGFIIARFSGDADLASSGVIGNIKTIVTRACSSVSLVGVLLYNSWQLAIIAVVILGTAFAPVYFIRKRLRYISNESVKIGGKIISRYNETFAGNRIITSYNLQGYQHNRYNSFLTESFNLGMKMVKTTGWLTPLAHFVASIGIASVIGYGSHLIVTGTITPGNFVSFITALLLLYQPVKSLGNTYVDLKNALLAMERVFNILDHQPEIQNNPNAVKIDSIKQQISFENLWFEYNKDCPVLKDINLNIKIGETIAVVGNSGGGKTSLVTLIPRFYDVISGRIAIDGVDIRDIDLESLRDKIAVVFQDNVLFEGTIKENILIGKLDATEQEIQRAIKGAYLDEFIASLEKGLDTEIGERGVMLSGGQRQRIAIARALLKDAPIVILDEATSALDNKSEAIVQMALDTLMQNRTVFVIAHRLSTVKNATRIAVINEGQIVEVGSHDELMQAENGAYKTLYMTQFKSKEADHQVV
ncbi:MAG: Phospholipid-lipopolysaccharide ABC transporter [uncultured bacterium]|nr:MAG: Phospholipid-lipopolysaccharide ABC transporter [uncultured bacterium]